MTRSTGPEDAGDRDDAYVPGAYAMERHLREIARFMVGRQFATVEEAQRALAERFVGKRMDTALPEDPIERAQEYAFRAMEARDVVESLPWVEQALALDPECPDALRLKAAWEGDPKRRDAFLARAAATALARLGGEEFLRRERGHVWRVTMARPYMRVVAAQAEALHAAGPLSDAAEAYGRLLDLDTGDSMGVRYTLQEIHLERGDVKAWEALWRRYEDEKSAFFLWGAVLAALLKGDEAAADRARALAEKSNRHVPRLLLEPWRLPEEPDAYSPGSEDEAGLVARGAYAAWTVHERALPWLLARTAGAAPPSSRQRRLYESLRPAGSEGPVPAWLPWLFECGVSVPPALRRVVRAGRTNAVPWLLAVLEREDLARDGSPGGGFAPVAAATLLGACRAEEAIGALLGKIRTGRMEDVLTDQAAVALGSIGAPAVEAILAQWDDPPADWDRDEWREVLCGPLARSDVRDARVLAAVEAVLWTNPSVAATYAEQLGDPALLPAIVHALDECDLEGDDPETYPILEVIDLADAVVRLGGCLTPAQAAKRERAIGMRREAYEARQRWREEDEALAAEEDEASTPFDDDPIPTEEEALRALLSPRAQAEAPRPGRDDPCWCGSGRKYKRCHRASDRAKDERGT